jgi:hypothetical protein
MRGDPAKFAPYIDAEFEVVHAPQPQALPAPRGKLRIHWPFGLLSKVWLGAIVFAVLATLLLLPDWSHSDQTTAPASVCEPEPWRAKLERLDEHTKDLLRRKVVMAMPVIGEKPTDPVVILPIDPPGPSYTARPVSEPVAPPCPGADAGRTPLRP